MKGYNFDAFPCHINICVNQNTPGPPTRPFIHDAIEPIPQGRFEPGAGTRPQAVILAQVKKEPESSRPGPCHRPTAHRVI